MDECIRKHQNPIIVFQENRRTAEFVNQNRKNVTEADVDGCLIKSGERCDYFLQSEGVVWYVELKGSDVSKALSQIVSTSSAFASDHGGMRRVAVIVSGSIPSLRSKEMKRIKQISESTTSISDLIVRSRKVIIEI